MSWWTKLEPKDKLIRITDWMACLASGLSALHKKKIKHQDIKPENVLLDAEFLPVICDFGLSKAFDEQSKSVKVQGTRAYLPPEQLTGKVGRKGDIFSLGLIFAELGLFYSGSRLCREISSGFYMDIREKLDDTLKKYFPFKKEEKYADLNRWIESFRGLLKNMLQTLPENRPKAPEVWEKLKEMVEILGAKPHCMQVSPMDSMSTELDDEEHDTEILLNENNFDLFY
jgi:serine/threonine protein kinase